MFGAFCYFYFIWLIYHLMDVHILIRIEIIIFQSKYTNYDSKQIK